jgi:UDP-N-acetylmuramate dehydrogenase
MPVAPADAVAVAVDVLGEIAEPDGDLAALTTYRVGGRADVLVRPRSIADLELVAEARRRSGLPLLVVGRGSNLLVADAGFRGIAVVTGDAFGEIDIDVSRAVVRAGGGVLLPVLARRTSAAGLTGLEWAVGVPGSVGGAVRMNAGGHGSDIAASLLDADLVDLDAADGTVRRTLRAGDLGLRFRSSDVGAHQVVVAARFRLAAGDRETSERQLAEIVAWRREHQPGGQNAGSVFVNPVPGRVSAGELVDRVGLRGFRHRTATVSDKHANFIQADAGGSADDVRALMGLVRDKVRAETGHALRSEIRLVGFGGALDDAHDDRSGRARSGGRR